MAHYLVRAKPDRSKLEELERQLEREAFVEMQPFGRALTKSLVNARVADGEAVWEEEDYCRPPLAEEREAVLDEYFDDIRVEAVSRGEGWSRIAELPKLFPRLAASDG